MIKDKQRAYRELIAKLQEMVNRTLPPEAEVLVVSKGDDELLKLGGRRAWHFPQREDGVYAGYYPPNSAAAIAHLEALQSKGAEYLLFPGPALWWLEHYPEFRQHLESHYHTVAHQEDICLIFSLQQVGSQRQQAESKQPSERSLEDYSLENYLDKSLLGDLRTLFDLDYYSEQAGAAFSSLDAALIDYLERGYGYNPHLLFDTSYYLNRYPHVKRSGANPLIHFLTHSVSEGQDPHPYFDTEFYYSQTPRLREKQVNALVHYLTHPAYETAPWPNPLFRNRYYLNTYQDVAGGKLNPLVHYLKIGFEEGRFISHVHKNIAESLLKTSRRSLLRGNWKNGTVLLFSYDGSGTGAPTFLELADALSRSYHVNCFAVLFKRQELLTDVEGSVVVLDDFQLACDIFRPSALRMLVKTLCAANPLFAVCEAQELLETLRVNGVPSFYLYTDVAARYPKEVVESLCHQADRVIFASSADFHALVKKIGFYPTNVALRPPASSGGTEGLGEARAVNDYVGSLVELVKRDLRLPETVFHRQEHDRTARKIVIPYHAWGVSGVSSALEAMGKELIRLGWDVEIVFTRERAEILETAGGEAHMPQIPYRYLQVDAPGIEGMWEALISYLENNAPCIMFMAYDFPANSIAPALTDRVGVVAWLQADDSDYYEQAYRLGRYCNALVCVSKRIKKGLAELNPVIGERAQVIYNSSVWDQEIVERRPARSEKMKLIYTGRLVQYQKRILDFIELARSLDGMGVDYRLTLAGEFSAREKARDVFNAKAKAHLEDRRIVLLGRMTREQILEALSHHDMFILLSDFEGLPLSLLEAMARGCVPVVAEMESGIPEVIESGKNGLIVSGRDYDEWARLLVELWKNSKKFSAMSKEARKAVRERFTMEQIGKQFAELFGRIADEIRSGEYKRPPCLNWGETRSLTGDVLPPPSMFRPPMPNPRRRAEPAASDRRPA